MWDIIRDAPVGTCLRYLIRTKSARYPEERAGFHVPDFSISPATEAPSTPSVPRGTDVSTATDISHSFNERCYAVVAWYSDQDPENPHNWSFGKKLWVSALLFAYTFSAYIGASLYVPGESDIVRLYGVNQTIASLGLSLYVVGYGIGPMIFSPLSEIPRIGRNIPYITTYIVFFLLCIPMIFVEDISGILVLRLLLGFFGSPCLATAGASYGDFYGPVEMPYVIALWGGGATLAPALGPLISGFAVEANGWRWSSWELLWLTAPILLLMFISMPETSAENILLRRAKRLRALTGRKDLKSHSEVRQSELNARAISINALVKPWQINALDPAVLFSTFYTALTYAIYYSFFESFPTVYIDIYGFSLGELGLAFVGVLIGLFCAVVLLVAYLHFVAPRRLAKLEPVPPEARIWPGLFATFLIPTGLFIFAWTAQSRIHWAASLSGVAISMCGVFIITQCMFIYLPFTYPKYAGSLFAANGFARSLFAAAAILYSPPMFSKLGISGGVSLLASFSVLCIVGMFGLYWFGAALRQRSRFAVS